MPHKGLGRNEKWLNRGQLISDKARMSRTQTYKKLQDQKLANNKY